MTFRFNNVYLNNASVVAGRLENKGPLSRYFDKVYDDYYMSEKTVEMAEVRMQKDSINILLDKINKKKELIDLIIGGDLTNQISTTSYAVTSYNIPFLGIYSACTTSMEALIIGSSLIDGGKINNSICITSSHNLAQEKQFRYPIEYGGPKPLTSTFTTTGAVSTFISNQKSKVKITSGTIGKIVDMGCKDPNNMGACMAPAAADTIAKHLKDMNRDVSFYDLILTGDLGIYGKEILKDYIMHEYHIGLGDNYNDCGVMLYDDNEKEIPAGGSGCACSALVNFGYIFDKLKKKELKKVLLVTTGALFNPIFNFQKENILGIAHAVSLEVE